MEKIIKVKANVERAEKSSNFQFMIPILGYLCRPAWSQQSVSGMQQLSSNRSYQASTDCRTSDLAPLWWIGTCWLLALLFDPILCQFMPGRDLLVIKSLQKCVCIKLLTLIVLASF